MTAKENLFNKLEELNIKYQTYNHEPLLTIEQSLKAAFHIPGIGCKNLFLKDNKNNLYLIVAVYDTKIALKPLSKNIKAPELRFANEELLKQYLGVVPGSVTPFGILNDKDHNVKILLDSRIFNYDQAGFHPLENTQTTVISTKDLKKFIEYCGNFNQIINFENLI
ncbi:prolyl-tRNA synthetase associated domain-containing protein [Candidatus Dependentiae bacterium]|nr:prolyl-tRNA synthetase associated domain-containing protein [Candidatus Dependentiae bacterium]